MADSYDITIRTGTRAGAGTDATISVTVLGSEGSSGPHKLDKRFVNDFESGSERTYTVKAPDLGQLLALRFHSAGSAVGYGGHWMMDWAVVTRGDRTWRFPKYSWLKMNGEITALEGTAMLPEEAKAIGEYDLRRAQIQRRRERYVWRENDGSLPGSLAISKEQPIPIDETYRDIKQGSYQVVFADTMAKMSLTTNVIKRAWTKVDDINELFRSFRTPEVAGRWRDDLEFGRAAVQGVSPVHIQLVTDLPEGMNVTADHVYGNLEPGLELADALAAKRVFLIDFSELDGIPMFKQEVDGEVEHRFAPSARCLLFRQGDGQIRPIAIQLGRDPETCPIFTPKDDPNDWTLAKMYVRCAEGNVHQMLSHAVLTHFVMEPFVMVTMRNLAESHPVFKILKRHFRYTLAINEGARESLLAEGGVFDLFMATGGPDKGHLQLAVKGYSTWNLTDNMLPRTLKQRGVDDPEVLPYYPYRDDALPIWYAIDEMVHDLLKLAYADDAALVGDEEMQDWWNELKTRGLRGGSLPFDRLEHIPDLCLLLTTVIFTVSVQHCAVNYLQYEHYAFVPNAPLCMRKAPPRTKGDLNEQDVVDAMPNRKQSSWQVAIGRALASFGRDEEYLLDDDGQWAEDYHDDDAAQAIIDRFQVRMSAQQARVDEANEKRPVPYTLLEPKRIPTSITI